MSVPLPSPSPLSPAQAPASAKPIPRYRPGPISTGNGNTNGNGNDANTSLGRSPYLPPSGRSPSSPSSSSFRNSGSRSVAINSGSLSAGVGASDDNWRDRATGMGKSAVAVRTVGGFEKKGGSSPTSITGPRDRDGKDKEKEKDKEREKAKDREKDADKDKDEEGKPALSHVPCRFFKAGACTAGSSCPFSHEEGGKREVCQWFLKGNCKFGHKCALAHVRPGEPMSMDRKNKKAAQLEARDREAKGDPRPPTKAENHSELAATPVPIRSALSSSIQSPPAHRLPSSPLREPIGPPAAGPTGGTSPGFARSPIPPNFASSPSRPSPLSASFGAKASVPGPLSLKAATATNHSPLRPPSTAFSSSFSHSTLRDIRPGSSPAPPLSASFADGMRKNIWARNESPMDQPEVLSPRRPIKTQSRLLHEDVFDGDLDDEDHGEDLLPSSLSDLLTPRERARRMSRRDSNESFSASPGRAAFTQSLWANGERLAQSAGATMGPGFLQGLWSAEGEDARRAPQNGGEFAFGPGTTAAQQHPRQSLLTQQRSPVSPPKGYPLPPNSPHAADHHTSAPSPFLIRALGDPSSPSARALSEHAPGQSLPGGLASALSRLHLHGPKASSGLAQASANGASGDVHGGTGARTPEGLSGSTPKRDEHDDDALFAME